MVSAKLATSAFLKTKVFWKKSYAVIVFVHDVTKKISSSESNHIDDGVI